MDKQSAASDTSKKVNNESPESVETGAKKESGNPETSSVDSQETSCQQRLMRVSADFSNFKRRVEKERSGWIMSGQAMIIKSFLPCIDDIDRACASGTPSENLEGLLIIQKNAHKTLTDIGVTPIDCSGDFDPSRHEALVHVDSPDHKTGEIIEVLTPGYLFKDTVLRFAQVSVAK